MSYIIWKDACILEIRNKTSTWVPMFEQQKLVNQPTDFRINSTIRTALQLDTVKTPDLFRTTEYLGSTITLKVYM